MATVRASVFVFVALCICCLKLEGNLDASWISGWCDVAKFPPYSDNEYMAMKLIGILRDNTSMNHYNQYSDLIWYNEYHIYGRAACNGKISRGDCSACLQKATESLTSGDCMYSVGAQVKLKDCRMRYEPKYFEDE
ncbi:hypothetical protein MLD38_018699 [Melastoma candidum]|uniref:Uncharacterized protein n=1 Tax=Melastoma candidum TaxID=119954 RepID=A0ACB9QTT7_9MYRT|nr:hypothetical protein MLD38_018699 [Melastoma candidum]